MLAPRALNPSERARLRRALEAPADKVLRDVDGVTLRGADLRRVLQDDWLNDEAINVALGLLRQRVPPARSGRAPRAHVFSSQFFAKLAGPDGLNQTLRWIGRARVQYNVFECDLILFPINVSNTHWVLAAFRNEPDNRRLELYDSWGGLGGEGSAVMPAMTLIEAWIRSAAGGSGLFDAASGRRPHAPKFEVAEAPIAHTAPQCAKQGDGASCGLFLLAFAEALALGRALPEDLGAHVQDARRALALELLGGGASPP